MYCFPGQFRETRITVSHTKFMSRSVWKFQLECVWFWSDRKHREATPNNLARTFVCEEKVNFYAVSWSLKAENTHESWYMMPLKPRRCVRVKLVNYGTPTLCHTYPVPPYLLPSLSYRSSLSLPPCHQHYYYYYYLHHLHYHPATTHGTTTILPLPTLLELWLRGEKNGGEKERIDD